MNTYSDYLDNLFKSIGFYNYSEMLKSAMPKKDTLDEEKLLVFRTIVNEVHPIDQTKCRIHFVFTIVWPGANEKCQFKNIFAYLVQKRGKKACPAVEADYWPKGSILPTKAQIIRDVLDTARWKRKGKI